MHMLISGGRRSIMPDSTEEARFWDRAARKYATDPIKDMCGYERTLDRVSHWVDSSDTVPHPSPA
jgi:hypothetical protein